MIDVYGISSDTTQRTASAVSVRDVSAILPLNTWRHVVLERTGNPLNPIQLFVNGNPVALQYTANDLDSASIFGGDAALMLGSYEAPHLTTPSGVVGSIKNLRIYNQVLLPAEIRQNAYNHCQTPVSKNGLLFWSALNNADSNKVQDLVTQQYGALTGFDWEPFAGVFPLHRLPTTYEYSSYGQVVQQYSPDGDTTQFFYDRWAG